MNVNSVNIRAPNLECLLALSHCALLILPTKLIHRSLPPWPVAHADKTICSSVTAEVQARHPLPPRWKSYSCLADVNNHTSWPCHLCKLPRPQTAFAVNPPPTRRCGGRQPAVPQQTHTLLGPSGYLAYGRSAHVRLCMFCSQCTVAQCFLQNVG